MRITDLGVLDGPVWLFGGVVSNLAALRAFLVAAGRAGVPAGRLICTGDMVGYCAHGAEAVALAREAAFPLIAGNVERQLAAGAGDCGCGFAPGTTCERLSLGWYGHAQTSLDTEARDWMAQLPDAATFAHDGRRYAVVHGGFTDIARYLWPTSPESHFHTELQALRAALGPIDGVIAGHAGLAFQRIVDGVHWINAGALGLPPHDGRPETRYVVLKGECATVERLRYDPAREVEAMRESGLDQGYERTLVTGYWPSQEVLPGELRQ